MTLAAAARLKDWFVGDALPLWSAQAYDQARGGFYESLDFNGEPVTGQPRRVRVQARQIHTFSEAGERGWHDRAEAIAAEGFEYFLARACPENGARGCVHLLSDDGSVLDDRRDLYDQAFLLLGCAGRWRAAKDRRALDLANRTVAFLDRELASPHGGWLESDRRELPRRQNPHMHLLEAFLALHDATDDARYIEYASAILDRCFTAFYDLAHRVIRECFDDKLAYDHKRSDVEPGHMFEWVWLLRNYEHVADADFSEERNILYIRGAHLGEDPEFFGFVSNRVALDAPDKRSAKRLWPQTEYLKASFVQARSGDDHARDRAAALIDALFASYLKVDMAGLWIDEFDGQGAPIAKDVPASILYHLSGAAAEADAYAMKERT